MSRIISEILGAPEPSFSHSVQEWEARSGRPGHDIRLVSDIRIRAKQALNSLGFDQEDTTARELYFALQHRARDDDRRLAALLGVAADDTPEQATKKILSWLDSQTLHQDVWVIKGACIRSLLKKQPAKTLMKALGLRSVESMLKRNSPCELLPLADALEKPEWVRKFKQNYRNLQPTDFQAQPVSIHVLSQDRVDKLKKSGYPVSRIVTPCHELGSLIIISPKERFTGDVLAITVSVIEAVADLRRHSAYYRIISVRGDFGIQVHAVNEQGITRASRHLSHIGWSTLHKHLIGNKDFFERIEQPYLEHEDLLVTSTGKLLADLHDSFSFWNGLDHVFYIKPGEPSVSMHIVDVAANASNHANHVDGALSYGRARLWDELWSRYLYHDAVADDVSERFLGPHEL